MKKIKLLFLVFFCAFNFSSNAQFAPTFSDAGMWNTLNIDYAINLKEYW